MACERGYRGMSVRSVVARAGVSHKTFYQLFDGLEDCSLAAIESCLVEIAAVVSPAYEAQGKWSARVRAALVSLLAFLEHDRNAAGLVLSYLAGYGPNSPHLRVRVLGLLQRIVADGRSVGQPACEPAPLAAEFVVGGVLSVVHSHLGERSLVALVNPLMWMIALPYLGPAAARRELTRPAPERRPVPTVPSTDPLDALGMRLTYRTVRVLEAIALAPGASNREIGERAGIADQGQISKLLTRLARLGLLENTGVGQAVGGANAWHLSSQGSELAPAIVRMSAGPELM